MLPEQGSPVYHSVQAALARCAHLRIPAFVMTSAGRVVDVHTDEGVVGRRAPR